MLPLKAEGVTAPSCTTLGSFLTQLWNGVMKRYEQMLRALSLEPLRDLFYLGNLRKGNGEQSLRCTVQCHLPHETTVGSSQWPALPYFSSKLISGSFLWKFAGKIDMGVEKNQTLAPVSMKNKWVYWGNCKLHRTQGQIPDILKIC